MKTYASERAADRFANANTDKNYVTRWVNHEIKDDAQ